MKQRNKIFVLVAGLIFLSVYSYGQLNTPPRYILNIKDAPKEVSLKASIIPANYYTQTLGFFCKKEIAFEKLTKVQFKFRLGSVEYCNYLEGKK